MVIVNTYKIELILNSVSNLLLSVSDQSLPYQ